jgi:hypothetical protein
MPKGHYKRKTPEIDYRQILALLPGRLIVKQLIEREIAVIRASIKGGIHREYLALLPGLEMEQQRIGEVLGSMTEMSRPPVETPPAGAEVIDERRMLAAPAEVLDAATLISRPFWGGDKPTSSLLVLRELMEHGRIVRKAFVEKYGAERSTLRGTGFSNAVTILRKAGVRMKNGPGTITLLSKIGGKLPEGTASKAVGERKTAPQAGSQSDYLIRAFKNNPDHILDLKVAHKETGAVSYNSIQVAVSVLRRRRNMNIITLGQGRYQLVPRPAERKAR